MSYTKIYKYLGILFGPKVDQEVQYKAVFDKVEAKLRSYARPMSRLTPARRIDVYNIFIHPLFSYVADSSQLPMGEKILTSISSLLYGGASFRFEQDSSILISSLQIILLAQPSP